MPNSVSNLPWRLRIWFAQGDSTAAARLIRAYEPTTGTSSDGPLVALLQETVGITLGHISLCEGKFSEAEVLLARIQQEAEKSGRMGNVIEIMLLRALVARAVGNMAQAINLFSRALKHTEPEGYIRVFVDLGMPMAALLREAVSQGITSNFVRELLAEFEKKKPRTKKPVYQPLVEFLTKRELEVLRRLADGLSNEVEHQVTITQIVIK